ncbi:hypothetical protein COS75_02310 [Candidatus Pacearchaeota archaeon CG06_land_8_20_14_3_00_35_12]|nr:MAG: hypothetical protein COS75_02310 [Candidatus Pacearchaeota archaeon CG06_land_8_20_14_3_00_35_12]
MPHKEILDDICSNCGEKYCTLKEILLKLGISDRELEQLKCIEILKYDESGRQGKDIGWDNATKLWFERGYDKKYREIYKDGMKHREIYKMIMGE